jgi:hypothetical protein
MPVFLLKALLKVSSAFFIEAAANIVMLESGERARAGEAGMPTTNAAAMTITRSNIVALLRNGSTRAGRAALGKMSCQEWTNPEAPFRGTRARLRRVASRMTILTRVLPYSQAVMRTGADALHSPGVSSQPSKCKARHRCAVAFSYDGAFSIWRHFVENYTGIINETLPKFDDAAGLLLWDFTFLFDMLSMAPILNTWPI